MHHVENVSLSPKTFRSRRRLSARAEGSSKRSLASIIDVSYSACMPPPLAYFLTWTTYGTWLHGDNRGSVDRRQNRFGSPEINPNPSRKHKERYSLGSPIYALNPEAQTIVHEAIQDHAAHRGWEILAISVRTNHVHVVVDCRSGEMQSPERVMQEFKSWGTRRLKEHHLASPRVWTDHGSTRWINNERGLVAAIDYVTRFQ